MTRQLKEYLKFASHLYDNIQYAESVEIVDNVNCIQMSNNNGYMWRCGLFHGKQEELKKFLEDLIK